MKLQEALRLLDIVTDVNGQYSKEERMHAAMRLEELLRLLLPEELLYLRYVDVRYHIRFCHADRGLDK